MSRKHYPNCRCQNRSLPIRYQNQSHCPVRYQSQTANHSQNLKLRYCHCRNRYRLKSESHWRNQKSHYQNLIPIRWPNQSLI